jgi:hypothetical protein
MHVEASNTLLGAVGYALLYNFALEWASMLSNPGTSMSPLSSVSLESSPLPPRSGIESPPLNREQSARSQSARLQPQDSINFATIQERVEDKVSLTKIFGKKIHMSEITFQGTANMSFIHAAFIQWRLANAFVLKRGRLIGMISRKTLHDTIEKLY